MARGFKAGYPAYLYFYTVGHELRVSAAGIMLVAACRVSILITPSRACSVLTPQFDFVENNQPVSLQLQAYALGLSSHTLRITSLPSKMMSNSNSLYRFSDEYAMISFTRKIDFWMSFMAMTG